MDNLDPKVLWNGAVSAHENSKVLLNTAMNAASLGNYGLASSLAVLSSEETIKAYALLIRSLDNSGEEPLQLKKYFSDHQHKHTAGAGFLALAEVLKLMLREMSIVGNDTSIPNEQKAQTFLARQKTLLASGTPEIAHKLENTDTWCQEANAIKNKGLYVNWVGKEWSRPNDIQKKEFDTQASIASALGKLTQGILGCRTYSDAKEEFEEMRLQVRVYQNSQK